MGIESRLFDDIRSLIPNLLASREHVMKANSDTGEKRECSTRYLMEKLLEWVEGLTALRFLSIYDGS